jgi:hypothetical protein
MGRAILIKFEMLALYRDREVGQACIGIESSVHILLAAKYYGPLQYSSCGFMTQVYYHGAHKTAVS